MHHANARSIAVIVLTGCAMAFAGSLMSILVTAISNWLTGSGVVTPGGAF